MRLYRYVLLATALFTAGCDHLLTVRENGSADIRVINASRAPIDVLVDDKVVLSGLAVSAVSEKLGVTPGEHTLRLRAVGGSSTDLAVTATAGSTLTTVVMPTTGSALAASVLADTGSIVPAGKSKLRVSHLAASAPPIDIWRTQPDYGTPIRVMFPFRYRDSSPYLQSDPGNWEVFVTAEGGTTPIVSTGAISVPSGHRVSVVLVDSAGVLRLRMIAD